MRHVKCSQTTLEVVFLSFSLSWVISFSLAFFFTYPRITYFGEKATHSNKLNRTHEGITNCDQHDGSKKRRCHLPYRKIVNKAHSKTGKEESAKESESPLKFSIGEEGSRVGFKVRNLMGKGKISGVFQIGKGQINFLYKQSFPNPPPPLSLSFYAHHHTKKGTNARLGSMHLFYRLKRTRSGTPSCSPISTQNLEGKVK